MSRGVPLILLVIGVIIAFWAGGKWRHYRLASAFSRKAQTTMKEAALLQRAALWAAVGALAATAAYLVLSGTITAVIDRTSEVPARLHNPQPGASCTVGPSCVTPSHR